MSQNLDSNGCPMPPLEHLKPGASATTAVAAAAVVVGTFDREGGNPGPEVTPFGTGMKAGAADENQSEQSATDTNAAVEKQAVASSESSLSPVDEKTRREALAVLVDVLPHIKEDWLEKCVVARMIVDKWDLSQTASWIFDYENLAPRKEVNRKFTGDFSRANDYDSIKTMLTDVKVDKHPPEYLYYSALKLSQKFPQFSMYSLRQILADLNHSYAAAVFAIVEGLEKVMLTERKSWKDWHRNEMVYILVQRDAQWYRYPLCVVKGEKTWSKKKARFTPFPPALTQEIRLVEKALYYFEQKHHVLQSKLDAEEARQMQLEEAKRNGLAVECSLCFDSYLPEEQVVCSDGHEYCVLCLYRSLDEALLGQLKLSPEGDLPCSFGGCKGVFSLATLCRILPGDRLTRLEERIWSDFLARAELPNLSQCFACGYAEEIEAPPEAVKSFECKNPKCRRKWCRSCRNLWDNHVGKTCKEMSGDPEEELRRKYDEMMSDVVIRHCTRCKRPLQKVQGCNKLTCQCGAKMCYLCRRPIEDYSHFCRHPTNPGEGCRKCTSCKLWDDPEKVDHELRRKLQMQMQEELFEIKLAYAGKKASASTATPEGPSASVDKDKQTKAPILTPPPPAAIAPQQRQFAAIFGPGP